MPGESSMDPAMPAGPSKQPPPPRHQASTGRAPKIRPRTIVLAIEQSQTTVRVAQATESSRGQHAERKKRGKEQTGCQQEETLQLHGSKHFVLAAQDRLQQNMNIEVMTVSELRQSLGAEQDATAPLAGKDMAHSLMGPGWVRCKAFAQRSILLHFTAISLFATATVLRLALVWQRFAKGSWTLCTSTLGGGGQEVTLLTARAMVGSSPYPQSGKVRAHVAVMETITFTERGISSFLVMTSGARPPGLPLREAILQRLDSELWLRPQSA
eukprot:2724497-Amphidinium_carterae.1